MSVAIRLPSRIGTITLRSMMARDSSSFSRALRCEANSESAAPPRCAQAEGSDANQTRNAKLKKSFMSKECTTRREKLAQRDFHFLVFLFAYPKEDSLAHGHGDQNDGKRAHNGGARRRIEQNRAVAPQS